MLRALPDKPAHPAAISSEQDLLLHAGGAAVATEETKTPAPSATAANVTTALLVIVIVEPAARHQFGALSCVSPHLRSACMRHSFTCWHVERHCDLKSLSSQLGHRSIKITLDVYAKFAKLTDHAAADTLGSTLLGNKTGNTATS
jgi:hypothetical protein